MLCCLQPVRPLHGGCITSACANQPLAALRLLAGANAEEDSDSFTTHSGSTSLAVLPLQVTLPDGGVREGVAGVTTPLDIANAISTSLGKKVRCLLKTQE